MSTLLVTVDALRVSHLAQYGYERNTMPVLDSLEAEGATRYEAAYANGTNTGISIPSFLTSRYRGDDYLESGPTVATALPESVATAGIHSNTFFASKTSHVAGFDTFEDFGVSETGDSDANASFGHRTFRKSMDVLRPIVDRLGVRSVAERIQERVFPASLIHEVTVYDDASTVTERAIEWLDGVDGEFFLWIHYMDPHRPYGIDLEDPAYADPATESEIRNLMATAGIDPQSVTPDQRERIVDLYDSDIRYTSEHVARLFDWLRERERWETTDVVLTADHGEEFADHGYYFHRNRPYDELIHVPLYVKADCAPVEPLTEQRELLDIAPTVCDLFDVDPPSTFRGQSVFDGDSRTVVATGSFRDQEPVVGVRTDDWKYIAVGEQAEELYDVTADPRERENVSATEPDRCAQLRELVPSELLDDAAPGVPEAVDGNVETRLEELGYLE